MRDGLIGAAILALACGTAMPVAAQSDLLSYEELKACMQIQRDLNQRKARLDTRGAELRRNAGELDRIADEVADRRRVVDVYNQRLTAEYDRLRAEQYRMYDIYSDNQKTYNSDVAAYNGDLAEYDRRCGSKRYSEADMVRVRNELGM